MNENSIIENKNAKESLFCCPCCDGKLYFDERSCFCEKGHRFDRAKEGYVNLLTGRGGGTHGDNKEMIRARRAFLESGHYLPLRLLLAGRLKERNPRAVLDAGCGEGYYTAAAAQALPGARLAAVDISKCAAAHTSARLGDRAECAAASVYRLPAGEGRFDAIFSVFSPLAAPEFHRVLKKDGLFFYVFPGVGHLRALKELLYNELRLNELKEETIDGFELVSKDELRYTRLIEGKDLDNLFAMTPYFYRTPEEGKRRAAQCGALETEISFHLLIYRRN